MRRRQIMTQPAPDVQQEDGGTVHSDLFKQFESWGLKRSISTTIPIVAVCLFLLASISGFFTSRLFPWKSNWRWPAFAIHVFLVWSLSNTVFLISMVYAIIKPGFPGHLVDLLFATIAGDVCVQIALVLVLAATAPLLRWALARGKFPKALPFELPEKPKDNAEPLEPEAAPVVVQVLDESIWQNGP